MSWSTLMPPVLKLIDWGRATWQNKSEIDRAKNEVYKELAEYIADVKWPVSGNVDYEFYLKIRDKQPTFPVLDWYQSHKRDLFLRIDLKGGIRSLQRLIIEQHKKGPDSLVDSIDAFLQRSNNLDTKLISKYIDEVKVDRQKANV